MRITSLGYSPVNQATNYKNKQQKTVFKGMVTGIVKDMEKNDELFEFFNQLAMNIAMKTGECAELLGDGLGKVMMKFNRSFDSDAKEFVSRCNKRSVEEKLGINFEFSE